jgi:hypothetical protein
MGITVAALEERVNNHIKFFWVVVAAGFAWMGAITLLLIHVNGTASSLARTQTRVEIGLIRQNIQDYAALPANEFKGTLPDLSSAIAAAKQKNVKVSPKVIGDLQEKLIESTGSPNFWPAAAEFISYRSALTHEDIANFRKTMPRCLDLQPHPATTAEAISPGEQTVKINPAYYEDCQLQLDSPREDEMISFWAQRAPALTFRHCLVIYQGGAVRLELGNWPLTFENCLWDLVVSEKPPASGQKVTETLLTSNPDSFKFPAL